MTALFRRQPPVHAEAAAPKAIPKPVTLKPAPPPPPPTATTAPPPPAVATSPAHAPATAPPAIQPPATASAAAPTESTATIATASTQPPQQETKPSSRSNLILPIILIIAGVGLLVLFSRSSAS